MSVRLCAHNFMCVSMFKTFTAVFILECPLPSLNRFYMQSKVPSITQPMLKAFYPQN